MFWQVFFISLVVWLLTTPVVGPVDGAESVTTEVTEVTRATAARLTRPATAVTRPVSIQDADPAKDKPADSASAQEPSTDQTTTTAADSEAAAADGAAAENPIEIQPGPATGELTDPVGPHQSRLRAVRAIRLVVIVVSGLLSMFSALALMRINRLSHGKYTGRLWWMGLILIPGWLLVGTSIAWNNDLWVSWFEGSLL